MLTNTLRRAGVLGAIVATSACARASTAPAPEAAPVMREMRGVWVATVRNIDWPKDTAPAAQRAALIDLLDRAQAAGFNAIVFQVRPEADALYRSELEPWSLYMNAGRQGVDPGYDPLELAIAESHARGMELHAWINPFRAARGAADTALLAPSHVWNARRDLVRVYGDQLWLDPGEPDAREHTARVIQDLVRRYDLDGIHVDDYFYPYQVRDSVTRQIVDFPDSGSYARSGSTLSRDDWRRENIDKFVERMYTDAHAIKPWMKVGISPFGIWRPNYPQGACCFDAYASIYADARKWLREGWVDYFVPQLYWQLSAPQQPFAAIFDWWIGENVHGRHVWPGLATYRAASGQGGFTPAEIARQVEVIRARPGAPGHVSFNATTTLKRDNILDAMTPLFQTPALVPAFPWLDNTPPPAPALGVSGRDIRISASETPRFWLVRSLSRGGLFRRAAWSTQVVAGSVTTLTLDREPQRVHVSAVDHAGNVGAAAEYTRR